MDKLKNEINYQKEERKTVTKKYEKAKQKLIKREQNEQMLVADNESLVKEINDLGK